MSEEYEIEGIVRLEGRGVTAKITNLGSQFTTYGQFAKTIGYPDAVGRDRDTKLERRSNEMFRVLAKGEHRLSHYGEVYVIESADEERFLMGHCGLELIYEGDNKPGLKLREDIAEMVAEVERRAYVEGYEQGRRMSKLDEGIEYEWKDNANPPTVDELMALGETYSNRTAQEERDRIVERAKADVEGLKYGRHYAVESGHHRNLCRMEVIVNKPKRTVVVVLKRVNSGKVRARGIAKCAPGDCFNLHIGRAIALRRALGFYIPRDYLEAPQPTEARIGDVISVKGVPQPFRVRGAYEQGVYENRKHFGNSKIIDDSRSEEVDASWRQCAD